MTRHLTLCSVVVCLVGCKGEAQYGDPHPYSEDPEFFEPGDKASFGDITDSRPVVHAQRPPPPISGGTLAITADGALAIASDPDRDRVSTVTLATALVAHTIGLLAGDEPGRVVEGAPGHAYVALRGAGSIAALDLTRGAVEYRAAACEAPRGLAYDAKADTVHVACATGELVSLAAADGAVIRRLDLDPDLRDVLVVPEGLVVTRFKSARVIRLDAAGTVLMDSAPPSTVRSRLKPTDPNEPGPDGGVDSPVPGMEPVDETLVPAGAWRSVRSPNGKIHVIHQSDLDEPIDIGDPHNPAPPTPQAGPYGTPVNGCGGLAQPAVATVTADEIVSGPPLVAPPLAVDVAVSPDGNWLALAHAGVNDPPAVQGFGMSRGQVTIFPAVQIPGQTIEQGSCATPFSVLPVDGQTTAVAFYPRMDEQAVTVGVWFVAQTREPASLVLFRDPTGQNQVTVRLGGESVFDTGHEIFHRDAGGGIACASCHFEGHEDGRVWKFDPIGPRRTQPVDVGLSGTAPFHWDGDMRDLPMLVSEVFQRRMGGPAESVERVEALAGWLDSLSPLPRLADPEAALAVRGKALFESSEVGCSGCHSGDKLTNSQNYFVGTTDSGRPLQVPSLVGVGYRAPFLHDGRAATLRARFDPAIGGGDAHGRTSALTDAQLDQLIAYLGSL